MTNYLQMTEKDLDIKSIMDKLLNKEMTVKEASRCLSKSIRQTIRIKNRYIKNGSKGLIHRARGKSSNHKNDTSKYIEIIKIINEKYNDYGPTLITEKLLEKHDIIINIPTLRNQMIYAGIWKPRIKNNKDEKEFKYRERKENYGEMIQYDGSYHKWFEGRNGTSYQCLLAGIDDASGEVTAKFDNNEGLIATFNFWKEYVEIKGKPRIIYLDKFATYKINYPNATDDKDLVTQFGRVCKTLGIQLICANTPQAKGRIERLFLTLQDRLVKELRENNISDTETANKFLKEIFLPKFNKKFMVESRGNSNLHLPLRDDEKSRIDQIFSEQKERIIFNDFTIRFENKFYQLFRNKEKGGPMIYKKDKVIIEKHLNGEIKISKNGKHISYSIIREKPKRLYNLPLAPEDNKDVINFIQNIEEKEKLDIKIKEETKIKRDDNKETYFEKTGKHHPWMKGFKIGKTKSLQLVIQEQRPRKT